MANIGMIGLGLMGSRIAMRLLQAGHVVTGHNRTREKAEELVRAGMAWVETPREVAEAADITISMVSDTAALLSIAQGPDGVLAGLSPGKIYVDMSTVSPDLIRELAGQVRERGAAMLEAPVSGSIPAADSGTLIIYAGGSADALEIVRPVFEAISQKIIHVGENGQAMAIKVAINMNLAPQLITLFESLILAEKAGVPREQALDALLSSVAASPAMKYRAPLILNMPDEVWFNVKMMLKDLQLALDLGRETNTPLLTVAQGAEVLSSAIAMGYGDQDFAVLYKALARISGLSEV